MPFTGAFGRKHSIPRNKHGGRLSGYHQNLADLSRLVQIQNMIQQYNRDVEILKGRLNRLEGIIAAGQPQHAENDTETEDTGLNPPLPIAELKQLAQMAKRLR
jgi:hypothetical protein